MKLINKLLLGLIAFLFVTLTFPSCERIKRQDVLILYPSWAEGIAITNLAKIMLEDEGYSVVMKRIDVGPIYASLSREDADVCMDTWLPFTHADYWEKYGDKIDVLGTVFDDGITGLVVPTYVDINSIEELNENKDKFNGKIFGIAAGSGIYGTTEKALKAYDLEYNQILSSETSMVTALKKAFNQKEWIVITGWKPHFMWANFPLKTLEDPKGIYPKDEIKIIARQGFRKEQPELALYFSNFALSEDMLNELTIMVGENHDSTIGAQQFYEKYKTELKKFFEDKAIDTIMTQVSTIEE